MAVAALEVVVIAEAVGSPYTIIRLDSEISFGKSQETILTVKLSLVIIIVM